MAAAMAGSLDGGEIQATAVRPAGADSAANKTWRRVAGVGGGFRWRASTPVTV